MNRYCNSPAFADGFVFVANSYQNRGGGAVELRPKAGGIEAHPVWESGEMDCEHGGTISIDGKLYLRWDDRPGEGGSAA